MAVLTHAEEIGEGEMGTEADMEAPMVLSKIFLTMHLMGKATPTHLRGNKAIQVTGITLPAEIPRSPMAFNMMDHMVPISQACTHLLLGTISFTMQMLRRL